MKKIISLALAMILAFALAIPAFAADFMGSGSVDTVTGTVTWTPNGQESSATAKYTMAGEYTVTIPSTIEVGTTPVDGANTVNVTKAMLGYGQKLVVKASCSGELSLVGPNVNETVKIEYTITASTGKQVGINTAAEILTVEATGATGFSGFGGSSATLTATAEDAPYAGLYTDTVTFTISVE